MNSEQSGLKGRSSFRRKQQKKQRIAPVNRKASGRNIQPSGMIDPSRFVKKGIPMDQVSYIPTRLIADLPLNTRLIGNLIQKGYAHPTEIQDKTLEAIADGRDVLGIAQTGTGKTCAYLTPIVNGLLDTKPCFQALVVVPTRELAVQVEQEFKSITKGLNLFSACFIGGASINKDKAILRRPCHIVIGTPGRLNDLSRQRALNFARFNTLVLDEFDRLLDMGFSRDIQRIVQAMENRRQTILFSATEEKSQQTLIQSLLTDPFEVKVGTGNVSADHIDQEVVRVGAGESKIAVLLGMIRQESFQKVIVFDETKRGVSAVCQKLQKAGIKVDQIHGNKSQNHRINVLNDFRTGRIQVLIATDVAARGLDISEVTHVINFQQPKTFDSYIHRIGRTGRAGRAGKAYTFIN